MNIKIFVAVHGRHNVLKLFAKYAPFPVIAVASNQEDVDLCKSFGWEVTQFSNDVLSNKLQAGLKFAREFDHDGLLMVGSDDLISEDLGKYYSRMLKDFDFIAPAQCYLYDMKTGMLRYWTGYKNSRKGEPTGAGRLLRKDLLERIGYNLWTGGHRNGVDAKSWDNIRDHAKKIKIFDMGTDLVMVDLKDGESTTPISAFHNYPFVNSTNILRMFPELDIRS